MRRMILLTAILALVGMVALPAGAEPVTKTAYTIAECAAEGNPQNASEMKMWLTGQGGYHVRGVENLYIDYLLEDGTWVPFGTVASATSRGDGVGGRPSSVMERGGPMTEDS